MDLIPPYKLIEINDTAKALIDSFTTLDNGMRKCDIQHCTTSWKLSDPPAVDQLQHIIWHLHERHLSELTMESAQFEQLKRIVEQAAKKQAEDGSD